MTTTRPVPSPSPAGLPGRARTAFRSTPEARHVFFQPTGHGISGHTEGARQTAQTAALVIGGENRLALLFGIAVRLWLLTIAASAVVAVVTLFIVACQTVADKVFAAAVVTG